MLLIGTDAWPEFPVVSLIVGLGWSALPKMAQCNVMASGQVTRKTHADSSEGI